MGVGGNMGVGAGTLKDCGTFPEFKTSYKVYVCIFSRVVVHLQNLKYHT